jgi:polysaccharide biosynthesis protein PslH
MTRKALLVLPESAYPVIGGGPLRTASMIHALAGLGYQITAVHFRLAGDPDPAVHYPPGLLHHSHILNLPHHSKSFLARASRNIIRTLTATTPLYDRFSGFDENLRDIAEEGGFDLIWLEHFWLASYAPLLRPFARKMVMDLHNIESAYYESLVACSPGYHRPFLRRFAARSRDLEQRLLPIADVVITTSSADARRITHSNQLVIPNTIPLHPLPSVERTHSIVFTGNFAYTPNQQGLRWFLAKVWPQLLAARPDLRLRLVGKEIHYAHSDAPNIDYVGPVDDAVTEIARSRVAIVPLLSGSGTRLKILEAFASSTPVVSTPLGAEGLEVNHGAHLQLAASPQDFAQSVLDLFDNEEEAQRLATNARQLYERSYTWSRVHRIIQESGL